jgi:AmmeMemoRadiSam system protein B/AmmeMemoRadiSam system protein A
MMRNSTYVRPPAVAGSFYPDSPTELLKLIAGFFHAAAKPQISYRPTAIIAPHAGYVYSGQIAAKGYKILEGEVYKTVIVISPSHAAYFRGVAAFDGKAYATPLGEIPINRELTEKIAAESDLIEISGKGHLKGAGRSEHALEVQLPFLQVTLGNFDLVALVMGDQDMQTCLALGKALAKSIGDDVNILIIASSDLSHFHDSAAALRLDSAAIEDIGNLDHAALAQDLLSQKTEACGGGPIIATIIAAKELGSNAVEITGIGDSGDVTGDKSSVVGYMSAVIYKESGHTTVRMGGGKTYEIESLDEESQSVDEDQPPSKTTEAGPIRANVATGTEFGLADSDKELLLSIARESIVSYLDGRELALPKIGSEILNQFLGAFVTLHKHGELRGCIGTFRPSGPLCQVVAQMARQAAFSDYRFRPVTTRELANIYIEISVLTPMKRIEKPEDVVVGRDGLYVKRGIYAGVLLPQVPLEQGWDRETFLDHACLKAGLVTDSWHDEETELFVFQAEIFGEGTCQAPNSARA